MTTRGLVRASHWDPDRWRAAFRQRVVSTRASIAGHTIEITPEPLLRSDGTGGFRQSIRVRISPPGEGDTLLEWWFGARRMVSRTSFRPEPELALSIVTPGPAFSRLARKENEPCTR